MNSLEFEGDTKGKQLKHFARTSDEVITIRHEVDMAVILHKKDFEFF